MNTEVDLLRDTRAGAAVVSPGSMWKWTGRCVSLG